jgi:hypothetical protein
VPNAARVAVIRHRIGKPRAHAEPALRLPQQQCSSLGATVVTEFLILHGYGRDEDLSPPPAQIRTCDFPAYGSYLG